MTKQNKYLIFIILLIVICPVAYFVLRKKKTENDNTEEVNEEEKNVLATFVVSKKPYPVNFTIKRKSDFFYISWTSKSSSEQILINPTTTKFIVLKNVGLNVKFELWKKPSNEYYIKMSSSNQFEIDGKITYSYDFI